ncbi:MAG: amino acid adenylation domain-containing protein, partial [Bacteroidales bacterium]|nr:amino acid adenylation domain-containing protein [Bacteroidales bacterium]
GDISKIDNENLIHTKGVSKFDLTLTAIDYEEQILISFNYCTQLFKAKTIDRFIAYFKKIVNQVAGNEEMQISNIEILSKEERHHLLFEFNNTEADYPKDKTIHRLFEEQVEKTPDNIALVFENQLITYKELNEKSNQFARYLIGLNGNESGIIGILYEASIEIYVGIFGILKARKTYLPIDNSLPDSRIQFMLNDSCIETIFTGNTTKEYLSHKNICINNVYTNDMNLLDSSNLGLIVQPTYAAYIIYTSGSTGLPKGTLVEHRALVNLCFGHNEFYKINSKDRISKYAGFGFDASVWETFPGLIKGASLYVIDEEIKTDSQILNEYFHKKDITISFLPTQFCENFMEYENNSLRVLLTGGDKLKYFKQRKYSLYNNYGPTENTVVTTRFEVQKLEKNIPIGKPIENCNVFIVNSFNTLQPIGVAGELCISGYGLAQGYLNQVELTKEKFISHPFKEGERLYRTGDLARCLPDGNIEFLGRIDDQVKIRGFRIELGEIESILLKHENIKESVVLAIEENNDKYLCAYIVCKEELNHEELRAYLSSQVPDYMLPSYFVELESLPLNANGKVNRKVLPVPEIKAGDDYVAPSTEIEAKLLEIWSEVLNVSPEDISIKANFFAIGGHSLKASVLTGKIHKEIGVEFPLRDVFLHSSIQEQASQINTRDKKDFVSIPKAKEQEYYPLSSAQKRLYLLQQFDIKSIAYNMPYLIQLGKDGDKRKIEEVFKQLINRHESFRTSIIIVDGKPVQLISKSVEFELEEISIENTELENIRNKFIKPFDLSKAPFLRVAIVNIKGEDSLLMIDMHHIISDGASHVTLEKEFQALLSGEELAPLPLQYKDYSEWQNSKEQQELIKNQEQYWLTKFEGEIPVLNLPIDYVRPSMQSHEGATVNFVLSKEETEGLRFFTKANDLTLYMSLLSVFSILLSKLSGQDDITVGTPVAGRNHADLTNIVGMFINTLSIPNKVKDEESIQEFVSNLKQTVLGAYENQNYQFEDLVDKVSVERDTSRNPIFDVVINLLNQAEHSGDISGIDNENRIHTKGVSKFDLTLTAIDYEEQLLISFEYCTQLFKAETIDRFIVYFKQIVSQLARTSEIKISEIDILTEEEKHQLLYEFNNTETDYPKDKTIHQLFEEQVKRTPDNIALVYGNQTVTYKELNERSNQFARYLIGLNENEQGVIGILYESSIELYIGIFGILKAGKSYLPIDNSLPDSRIQFMLNDSCIETIFTGNTTKEYLSHKNICINNVYTNDMNLLESSNLDLIVQASNAAYIIYTSGSTGLPKGTLVEHRALVNLCFGHNEFYKINSKDHISKYAGFGFDASVWETFPGLIKGASLYVIDEEIKTDSQILNEYFHKKDITISFLPTQFCENFMEYENNSLRLLLTGGDKLKSFKQRKYRLYNNYGPTENTVVTSRYEVIKTETNIPIGKPIENCNVFIINSFNQIQPIGVAGELCVSGYGLAQGYLNQVELTAEKFISHPFKEGERLYRTGDLARCLPDGNIEFLGRIDHQVKIRGFRIELGEIESTLLKHENIKESVVLAREEKSDKYLCAYVVCKEEFSQEELRAYMSAQVPDYMIPSYFVQLESLPLTTNGKVNRKALPSPEIKAGDDYVAPKTKEERLLVDIWSKVLGVEGIGITDNFFSLGGDSIKTIQIQARLNTAGFIISVKDIFLNPIISDLAPKMIFKANEVSQEAIIGDLKLSPIQYHFLSDETEQHHFNQSVMLHSEEYLEEEKIKSVFRKLQEHHDALRITCKLDNAKKVSGLYNNGIDGFPVSLEVYDFREEKEASEKITSCADQIQRSIDLETGPLLKLGLFHLPDGDRLLIVIHHLVIDGISWRIIFEDIETLFKQVNNEEKLSLPLKSNSFRDWSAKLTEYSKTNIFLKEKSYWSDIVSKEEFSLNRQIDDENIEDNELGHTQFTLDQTATTDLLNNTNEVYGTEVNDILLCGLGYGVKKTLGNEKVLISLEGHGREDIFSDLDISRTIGWFTSVYPVLLDMTVDDLSLQIRNVKENLRQIPNKGIGFGILKYLTPPELKDNVNYDIEPQIEFNYLGQFDSDVDQMSLFKIAKESGGNSVSPKRKNKCDFSIGGMIANGKLSVNITYKKKYYSEELINDLLENYKKSLLEILNHCTKFTDKILTPSDFTYKKLSINEVDKFTAKYEIEDIYKLTPMQEGMLFHAMHDSESFAYFVQMNYRLNSEISLDIMRKSLNKLFSRHDILRTVFIYKEMQIPLQLVLKDRECEFDYKDIRELSTEEKQEYILDYKKTDRERGFRLDQDILMRVSLLQLNNNEYELIWSNHHILMDGWCISIINNVFFEIYNSLLNNRALKLNSVTPYKEYVKWLDGIDKNSSLKYWKDYLSGYEEQASLPNLSKKGNGFVQQEENLQLTKEISAKFQKIASENNVTANIIIQTVWAILLAKYSNKEDIVFGSVVSGRPSEIYGVESIVGLFINNVPVRIQFSQDLEFSTLIKRVQNSNLDSETHHYITLAEIQAQSILKQNLIDHILVFENYPIAEKIESLDQDNEQLNIKITGLDTFEQTNYNLTITASLSDVLHVNFTYNANMFDSGMMKSLKIHFENVINHIVSDSEVKISAIDILTEEEKHQLLYEFNKTETDYPKEKTIHQLFEEQVKQFPDKLALEYKNKTFTYQELNEESNKVANCLRKRNVFNEQLIGLMVNRSPEMIIGILGILKSGGAYVPIDPEYPKERINHLIKDSGVTILLSTEGFEKTFDFSGEIILLDGAIVNKSSINFNIIKNASNNLAYVMYTSGSTGQPKGVEVEHKNVVRLVKNTNYFPFSQGHKILQTGAPVFDATTFEIWGALLNGGCLHIPDNDVIMNAELFGKCVKENSITTVWLTSSLFNLLANQDINTFSSLSYLLVGGDVLSVKYINKVKEANKKLVLINGYGPTENTTFSTTFKIEREYIGSIPIGKPISNSTAYILDKHNKIQPIGVSGELLVGGDGIARKYLNNPELTREKFIPHPFKEGERLYKTGDLAKWLPDGNIEFLGRIDHQVKIRGFRIEVGEIEHVLLKHENIKESVVLALENNGDKYLCAYFVCKEELNHEELRAYMSAQVPDYMLPSYFVQLDELPLTSNGKVNRKVLPSPQIKAGDDYVAPSNEIEENLLEIWSDLLNIDKEEISVNANFFSIGGHSLKATILTGKIYKEIGVEFPLRDVFLHSTIKSQASQIATSAKKEFVSIPKAKEQSNYPLSSAQKRLYLLQQFDLTSTAYNMPNIIPLGKEADKSKIEEVFKQLINRHESFRTSINIVDQEPVQIISKDVEFELEELNIENSELENTRNKFIKPFDLSKAPFLRVSIVDVKGEESLLMIDMHHIISDGTSHSILEKEFQALFSREELAPLPLQYKDYSQWQNSKEQQELIKNQEEYWLNKFEGEIPVLNLPIDYIRPLMQSHEGATVNFVLSKEETEGIKFFTKENDLTLYMSLLSVFNILLSKLSGQEDIVVGTPIAGRNHAGLENIVGMFINTLSIRNEVKGETTIQEFVSSLKQTVLGAYENQNYQFEELVNKVSVERDTSRNPIFDVMINLLNQAEQSGDISGFNNQEQIHEIGISKFDLSLSIVDFGEQLLISFEYCTQLFKAETIDRFIEYFKQIVSQLADNLEKELSAIEIITESEKQQLLFEFNDTQKEYPEEKTIYQLFEEQVERTPENTVLVFEGKEMTYRDLNSKSNQLARLLWKKGVGSETIIGIMLESSFELIIGIMGILKAGGAYLPIDPMLPESRKQFMLNNSHSKILLTVSGIAGLNVHETLFLDSENIYNGRSENLNHINESSDSCYIIYTSGSTGVPKGVVIEHTSVVNFIYSMYNDFKGGFSTLDSCLSLTRFTFDVSVAEYFLPMSFGAKLVFYDSKEVSDIKLLTQAIVDYGITFTYIPPSLLRSVYSLLIQQIDKVKLNKMLVGVEPIKDEILEDYLKLNENFNIINAYGPTESTICATRYLYKSHLVKNTIVPIGQGLSNSNIYLLDQSNKLVPIGVSGELCISGVGLSRGYLNNPELSSEKFIDHPFKAGERLYKTGDLARYLPDGNIEFLGRIDHQVKIRGFRIELGEIENILLKQVSIKECLVLAREENEDKYLCAYLVSEEDFNEEEIRTYLSASLPDYMIPSYFVALDKIPLTSNGKVNRKALPSPEVKAGDDYVAPSNEIEEKLVKIWSEVLNVPQEEISTTASFFAIGGHSLKATILVSKIHKELSVKLPLKEVFQQQTIKKMAVCISKVSKLSYSSINLAEKKEYYALSSAQKRLYFIQQMDFQSLSYNMPMVIPLGLDINIDSLENAFVDLVSRHESFRTSFITLNNEPVQRVYDKVDFKLNIKETTKEELDEDIKKYIKPFDLSKDILIRACLMNVSNEQNVLVVDMHHIISDGTTSNIVREDFLKLFNGEKINPLKLQYKDFSNWQNKLIAKGGLKSQENYWKDLFSGDIPVLNLQTDYKRPESFTYKGDVCSFSLNENEATLLKDLGKKTGSTLYMNILAVLNTLFYRFSNQEDIIIGSGIAGRPHSDLQGISGMFINTLALRNYPNGDKKFIDFLKEVSDNSIAAFENQDVQFEDLVDMLNIDRDISRNPLFDINMVVQNFDDISENQRENDVITEEDSTLTSNLYRGTSKFDMIFFVSETLNTINISIEYYSDIFKRETIEKYIRCFKNIVSLIIENPKVKLKEIELLSQEEKQQLLHEFNDTQSDYPKNKNIHELFEEQVEKSPNNIALVCGQEQTTYKELDNKSNQIAHYLLFECEVTINESIGIYMDKGANALISMLGILKSGCGYLPLSVSYPEERIKFMINDTSTRIIFSEKRYLKEMNKYQWECSSLRTYMCVDSSNIYEEQETQSSLNNRKLWEYVGDESVDEVTGGGWSSSYTGQAIPQEEMDEYGDNVLKK